jgi:NAD(P)-dependent dehydrogenase (short-subunit alcohol dehydrogenase family)
LNRLDGKVALVTGAASGIGEAIARLFISEGACVLVADIQDDRGKRLAAEMGSNAIYRHTDVSRESDVKSAVDQTVNIWGRLDCIVNNAGYGGVSGSIESIPVEGFDATVAVLLRGVFLGMKHAAPVMKKQKSGSIVNMGSTTGIRVVDGNHIYSAVKAAIAHLTRSVAMELGEDGIRVNCICPGFIVTPLFGKEFGLSAEEAASEKTIEALKKVFAGFQPINRAGMPEDVARAALWLAGDESTFVNGQLLVVDGGMSNGRKWSQFYADMGPVAAAMGLDL